MGFYFGTNSISPTKGGGGGGGGIGTTIVALNDTGASISSGDKVFILPQGVPQSYVTVSNWTNIPHFVSGDGTVVCYADNVYDVSTQTISSGPTDLLNACKNNGIRYTNAGTFALKYKVGNSTVSDVGMIVLSDEYAFEYWEGSSTSWLFWQIDSSLQKVSQCHCIYNSSVDSRNMRMVSIGNKIYTSQSDLKCIGTWTEPNSNIYMSQRSDIYWVLYATQDNKYVITADKGVYDGTWSLVNFVSLDSNYEMTTTKIFSNQDLNTMIQKTNLYVTFNNVTGVLCLSAWDGSAYGCFKYDTDTEDWETISLNLTGYTQSNYMMLTTTSDLAVAQYGVYLYTVGSPSEGYKAITFASFTQDGYTGIAASSASDGENLTVNTVLL